MRRKKIIAFIIAAVITSTAVIAGIYVIFFYIPTKLDSLQTISNFNKEVRVMLWEKYSLDITDGIEYIDGYYDNAFQDNSVYLTLRVPDDMLTSIYDAAHYKDTTSPGDRDSDGAVIHKRLEYDGELYTFTNFYCSEDGYTLVKFIGRYPGSRPGVK